MPDSFSISKRVPPFPSRLVLNSEEETRGEGEIRKQSVAIKKEKGKNIEGKNHPLFQCAKDFIIPNIYFTSHWLRYRGKRKKSEEVFRVRSGAHASGTQLDSARTFFVCFINVVVHYDT